MGRGWAMEAVPTRLYVCLSQNFYTKRLLSLGQFYQGNISTAQHISDFLLYYVFFASLLLSITVS